jgi:hypothetical protein
MHDGLYQAAGGMPRGMRSVDAPPPTPAAGAPLPGGPVAAAQLGVIASNLRGM